jgi:hypothetical protein
MVELCIIRLVEAIFFEVIAVGREHEDHFIGAILTIIFVDFDVFVDAVTFVVGINLLVFTV